jgi:hypothetical protein
VDRALGRQRPVALDQRAQLGPVNELHGQVEPPVDLAEVMDGDECGSEIRAATAHSRRNRAVNAGSSASRGTSRFSAGAVPAVGSGPGARTLRTDLR